MDSVELHLAGEQRSDPASKQASEVGVEQAIVSAGDVRQASRIGILVAGMHRSGTSASTRILSLLGADLPENLMPAHAQFNATGFWESNDVVALNEELLAAADSSWDDVLPFAIEQLDTTYLAQWQGKLHALLKQNFANSNWFIVKDPRLAKLLPCWLPVVQQYAQVKIIIPVRAPLEVAASLAQREGFVAMKSVYLWLRHMLDAIQFSHGMPRAIMVYEELLQDWRASVERVSQDLNLVWPQQLEQVAEEIDAFIQPGLQHHKKNQANERKEDAEYLGPFGALAERLYQGLLHRVADLDALAQDISQQLQSLESAFAPLMHDYVRQCNLAKDAKQVLEQSWTGRYQQLQGEFEEKCSHVLKLETMLTDERAIYTQLHADFEEKCTHVGLLMAEEANLRGHISRIAAQLDSRVQSEHDGREAAAEELRWQELLDKLQRSEHTVGELQAQINEQAQQATESQRRHSQCREEISRAEAQLDLLKDLFLHA